MIKALRLTLTDDDLARGGEISSRDLLDPNNATVKGPPTIVLPDGMNVVYIEMGGTTYYLDDSTGEAYCDGA